MAAVYDEKDTEHKYTLTDSEYGKLKIEFLKEMEKKGYNIDYNAYYPKRVTASCCCDRYNSAVVDAYGNIYKCWEEIGNKNACIGQLGADLNLNLPTCYFEYLLYDPTLNEECKHCKLLPICMGGGCPLRRARDNRRNCSYHYECLQDGIYNSAEKMGKKILEEILF